ncbi:class I SAM-dependent methyltransferase [uncultured Herbaspirillum sp.]|uniref:class I SAM-dependent methyltransferase n=1 Tax=uncultured Herbaspirillum sp. TaxID=160236 RepID=UPI00258FE08B|nr:class I SAM-dependent methyltransferase [uncultured Herbaspirillum sp.]
MTIDTAHPLQSCWDLALSSVKAQALETAIRTGLLAVMETPSSAEALAARLALHPASAQQLLDLLWSMGVVVRTDDAPNGDMPTYMLAPGLTSFLLRDGEHYYADALVHRLQSLRQQLPSLTEWLKLGAAAAAPPDGAAWAEAAQGKLAQEQVAVTVDVALACVKRLSGLAEQGRFLDLGGGPGKVGLALARHLPSWHGVTFDLPAATAVARHNVEQAGLADRLRCRGGDLLRDDIGTGYDLIWCSSVLHFVPELDTAVDRIRDALAPGGHFLSVHAELPADRDGLGAVLPYYLPLIMRGHQVWKRGTLARVVRERGLEVLDDVVLQGCPLTPAPLVIARRSAS